MVPQKRGTPSELTGLAANAQRGFDILGMHPRFNIFACFQAAPNLPRLGKFATFFFYRHPEACGIVLRGRRFGGRS